MPRVLLYEDNEELQNSMVYLLEMEEGFTLVAALTDADCILEDIAATQPDVILMDIEMPNSNGIEALKTLRKAHADLPVLMCTIFDDDDSIFSAISAGANGYILKTNLEKLPGAIEELLDGGAPMTGSIARKVLSYIPKVNDKSKQDLQCLTTRENELLQSLATGKSYKMIAADLKISVETVRVHIKNIYRKLHVSSATEAVSKLK